MQYAGINIVILTPILCVVLQPSAVHIIYYNDIAVLYSTSIYININFYARIL